VSIALPRVFTIAPTASFVDELAKKILDDHGSDPLELSEVVILLPTRRACRSLREAFLRVGDGKPMILPCIQPIGDVDEDELMLGAEGASEGATGLGREMLDLPEAIPGLRRELMLVQLILKSDAVRRADDGAPGLDAAQAAHLARDLAALLDQVQTERLSFHDLVHIVPEELASHWQLTLEFLKIVTEFWPKILAGEGLIDPAKRRDEVLRLQTAAWQSSDHEGPVYAAGSTGSIPATADLLKVIARLPQGAVVLPGLDRDLADAVWKALAEDPSHPQFGMHQLLDHIGINRRDVADWSPDQVPAARSKLLNAALLPAAAVEGWRETADLSADGLSGLSLLDCPGPEEEARTIALLMREALETPARTAALVTPDRSLARRVTAELNRWDIEVDDSAGRPLADTPVGLFLRLTAELVAGGWSPLDVLATLKHPLAMGGESAGIFRNLVRRLETTVLRGPRPGSTVDGLRAALKVSAEGRALLPWLESLAAQQADLALLMKAPSAPLVSLLTTHIAFAEALAASDEQPGAHRLWAGDDGEAAATFIDELNAAASVLPELPGALYPALLDGLMAGRVVRPRYGRHPRLAVWGLLEARLQRADVMILGGLNEGTWPPEVDTGPWLSRPMRAGFGLPQPERRIGLTAHDFVQAASGPNVILTRAAKVEGSPTVPARWLLRLRALLDGAGLSWPQHLQHLAWADQLDDPGHEARPCAAPRPCPPLAARPDELSVTEIETWLRDPYAIFAKRILKLKALDPIDADPGAAERGTFIHEALDEFVRETRWPPADDAYDQLLVIGRRKFGVALARPGVWAFWWPRFERAARWFVDQMARDAEAGASKPAASEVRGEVKFERPDGEFRIYGKADRIDRDAGGKLTIIDYKTGGTPSSAEVVAGFAPQLPVEGLIAEQGGFESVAAGEVSGLAYWRLSGGDPAGEIKTVRGDIAGILSETYARLEDLMTAFEDETTPYLAHPRPSWAPRYSDYGHLERLGEWVAGDDEGDGE
jgi:ATP-dependent helicase/nuclease subunit B